MTNKKTLEKFKKLIKVQKCIRCKKEPVDKFDTFYITKDDGSEFIICSSCAIALLEFLIKTEKNMKQKEEKKQHWLKGLGLSGSQVDYIESYLSKAIDKAKVRKWQ